MRLTIRAVAEVVFFSKHFMLLRSYLLQNPKSLLEIRSLLLLLSLTIATVHSREEQLTNSSIVFVYMSELRANYLINVFCLE